MYRVHREGCPALGLTSRYLQGVYTHRTHAELTVYAADSDACALGPVARPSRDQPTASDHFLGLHGITYDSRCRPAVRPGRHTCAPCHRLVGRARPNEPKSEELGRALLLPCKASDSSPYCSHVDGQRAHPSHQAIVIAASRRRSSAAAAHAVPIRWSDPSVAHQPARPRLVHEWIAHG